MTARRLVRRPRLVPVVRLEPCDLSPARPLPAPGDAAGLERRWRDCLADAGLAGLEPLVEQQHLVALSRVVQPALLRRLVTIHAAPALDPADPATTVEDARERLLGLPGGFALLDGEEVALAPGCCTGLDDLAPWRAAAAWESPTWTQLWNGHPPAHVRGAGERVEVAPDIEVGEPAEGDPRLVVERAALEAAVDEARAEVRAFAARLAPAVRAALGARAHLGDAVTALLTGLDGGR